jgi:hypothetical protein
MFPHSEWEPALNFYTHFIHNVLCISILLVRIDIATWFWNKACMAYSESHFVPGPDFSVKGCFGGSALRSNPKLARPFSSKNRMHLVIRLGALKARACGSIHGLYGFSKNYLKQVEAESVEVFFSQRALHIMARFRSRKALTTFLRSFCGVYARKFLGAERASPSNKSCFTSRPFSRILNQELIGEEKRSSSLIKLQRHLGYFMKNIFAKNPLYQRWV